MVTEVIASFCLFLGLATIGFGPALLLFRSNDKLVLSNPVLWLGSSPAIGLALVTLLAFPLYRYGAPVKVWGVGMAIALIVGSFLILVSQRKQLQISMQRSLIQDLLGLLLALILVGGGLATIALAGGINRVIFSFNPSDTLVYLSFSDSSQTVPWHLLWSLKPISFLYESNSPPVVTEGLRLSPTVLYSARMLNIPVRLATMIDLAWFAQVSGIGAERLLYAFNLAMSLCTTSVSFALLRQLAVSTGWSSLVATAVSLNFWAFIIRDMDAYSQAHCLPLLLLFFLIRIVAYASSAAYARRLRIAASIVLASVICAYTEFIAPLFVVFVGEMMLFWLRDRTWRSHLVELAWIGGATVGSLLLSGQLLYLAASLLWMFNFILSAKEGTLGSSPVELTMIDQPWATLVGITWLQHAFAWAIPETDATKPLIHWLLNDLSILSILAVVGTAIGVLLWGKRRSLILLAVSLMVYSSLSVYFAFFKRDHYSFVKTVSMGFPFVLIFASAFVQNNRMEARSFLQPVGAHGQVSSLPSLASKALQTLLVITHWILHVLIILSLAYGIWYVVNEAAASPPPYAMRYKHNDYDFKPYARILEQLHPQRLLVYVPSSEDWHYYGFVMLAVKQFNPYFQSGYLVNNQYPTLFSEPMKLKGIPDYALVSRKDDYIVAKGVGTPVFQGKDLILYQITGGTPELFAYRK